MIAPIRPDGELERAIWTELADDAAIARQLAAMPAGASPLPLAVKANIGAAGFVRSAGCRLLELRPEATDAAAVAALRRAGAVVVGMTNMDELAFGITSANASYGEVRVPGHEARSAGGSSGGSAAAVAAGLVPLALGTDTGGSVSIPASCCGVVGFRPSTGLWPTAGLVGLSWTRDTPGVFALTVREAREVHGLVARGRGLPGVSDGSAADGIDEVAAPLRLGIPAEFAEQLDPYAAAAFDAACAALDRSAELVPLSLGEIAERARSAEMTVVLWESRRLLGLAAADALGVDPEEGFRRLADAVASPGVAAILEAELAEPVAASAYAAAQRDVLVARRAHEELWERERLDALIYPAAPAPAAVLDAEAPGTVDHLGERVDIFGLYTRHTGTGTMLGVPMTTVPMPVGPGALPIGLTVQGRRFEDDDALAAAIRIEALLGRGREGC